MRSELQTVRQVIRPQTEFKAVARPRFLGYIDEFKKNTEKVQGREEVELDKKRRDLLEKPLLDAHGRKISGLELLKILQELSETEVVDVDNKKFLLGIGLLGLPFLSKKYWASMQIRSYPFIFRYKVTKLLYGNDNTTNEIKVSRALQDMENLGLVKFIPFSQKQWIITDIGYQVLEQAKNQKTFSTVPAKSLRLEQIRVLISENKAGYTGWELLRRLDKVINEDRHRIVKFFKPGLSESQLLSRLKAKEGDGVLNQLRALISLGLLEKVPTIETSQSSLSPESSQWVLSEKGRQVLKNGDPSKAGVFSVEDLKNILEYEIEQLKESQKQRDSVLDQIEALYLAQQAEVNGRRVVIEHLENEALKRYEEAKAAKEPKQREKLEKEAMARALEADALQEQQRVEMECLKQLEGQLQRAKASFAEGNQRTHLMIKNLGVALTRLKNAQVSDEIKRLTKDFHPKESAQEGSGQEESLKSLLSMLQITFDLNGNGEMETEELETMVQANATLQSNALEQAIQAIQAKSKPEGESLKVGPSKTLETLVEQMKAKPQEQKQQPPPK